MSEFDLGHNYDDGYGDDDDNGKREESERILKNGFDSVDHIKEFFGIPEKIYLPDEALDQANEAVKSGDINIVIIDPALGKGPTQVELHEATLKVLEFPPYSTEKECVSATRVIFDHIASDMCRKGRIILSAKDMSKEYESIVLAAQLEKDVAAGYYEATFDENGEVSYRQTQAGKDRMKKLFREKFSQLGPIMDDLVDLFEKLEKHSDKKNDNGDNDPEQKDKESDVE